MTGKLFIQAISKFLLGFLLVAFLLFLPAGTLCYWNAWLFVSDSFYSHVYRRACHDDF